MAFLSEMEVEHGGFQARMAHVLLDEAEVDACFQEVGCIGMAKGVDRDPFLSDACLELGSAESALDAGFGHRVWGVRGAFSISSESWEKESGVAVSDPLISQEWQSGLREGDIAILGTLASVDVDHHAFGVDV